jgi:hypothetical protein
MRSRMLLQFTPGLVRTTHFDDECRQLADRHYTRRPGSIGKRQFCYSGRKLVLRNAEGTVLFVWMWPQADKRMDGREGYNCAIFRNESSRPSSEIILEAERAATDRWGSGPAYTFIDARKLATKRCHGAEYCPLPSRTYVRAGWTHTGFTATGKHVFEKGLLRISKPASGEGEQR